jgi:hypothetical protein
MYEMKLSIFMLVLHPLFHVKNGDISIFWQSLLPIAKCYEHFLCGRLNVLGNSLGMCYSHFCDTLNSFFFLSKNICFPLCFWWPHDTFINTQVKHMLTFCLIDLVEKILSIKYLKKYSYFSVGVKYLFLFLWL